ncbi:hypothetical protein CMK11_00120, partial [Candidatus Poribacteria bacterium]|nr:hypothetical protein [Candidatus Poribacteria bacterium]
TQSGRAHLLFATGDRRPEQLPTLSATTARAVGCPDVELKFHGACVPLPPTVTEKGDYAWIAPPRSGGEALDSIPCWVDAIHEQLAEYRGGQERIRAVAEAERAAHDGRIREARANGATVRAETGAEERDRAMRYQAEVPGASEPGRYDALVSLAGRLAARGFSEPSAWSAMVEYGNRCDPPFSERAMRARTIHKYLAGISDYRAR